MKPSFLLALCVSLAQAATTQPADTDIPLDHASLHRHYILHLPADLDQTKPAPLVLMLHGAGGTAQGASTRYGWRELADKEHFIVAFPEATRFDMTRPVAFKDNPTIWNDASGRAFPARRNIDDVGYLRAVLDDIQRRASIDTSRIYCTGFSSGASMTFRAGIELSDRLTAIAPISGHLWLSGPLRDKKLARPVSLFFLTGAQDPLNPLQGGDAKTPWGNTDHKPPMQQSIDDWLNLLSLDPKTKSPLRDDAEVTAVRYGDENSDRQIIYYVIQNLGHEWPGHPRTLPRAITGSTTNVVDATTLIWQFFRAHHLGQNRP